MRQAECAKRAPHSDGMYSDRVLHGQFSRDFVQRQIRLGRDPCRNPIPARGQLAMPSTIALRARFDRARCPPEIHQIVDEPRRNAKVPRRLTMAVAFTHEGDNARTQLNRMWLAHL